jgi:Mn2+/Fe2+ NRAMP family transporter
VAQFLNVVQAMMLPFALIPVLHVCADQKVMGRFVSHPALTFFAGLIAATVAGVNGYLMVDFLHTSLPEVRLLLPILPGGGKICPPG